MLKSLNTNSRGTINIDELRSVLLKVGMKIYETETTVDGVGMLIPRGDM
jgi:hypothetical protein